jgi:hypothetical protein
MVRWLIEKADKSNGVEACEVVIQQALPGKKKLLQESRVCALGDAHKTYAIIVIVKRKNVTQLQRFPTLHTVESQSLDCSFSLGTFWAMSVWPSQFLKKPVANIKKA